jgi:hypothetical protein
MGAQEGDTDDGGVSLTTGSTMDFESENGMYSPTRFECSIKLFKVFFFIGHKSWNMQIPFFLIDPLTCGTILIRRCTATPSTNRTLPSEMPSSPAQVEDDRW